MSGCTDFGHVIQNADLVRSTHFDTNALALSSVGFSVLQSRIESFSINRYKLAVERSRNQVHRIIELLKNPSLHATFLEGNAPPLSAMLAPALGESLTRWEELGSGFSGHGFDDRDKERFLPDPNPPSTEEISTQTYAEWFKERRASVVHNASERLSNIRARLFRWRLHMREVEKEEIIHPPAKSNTAPKQANSGTQPHHVPADEPSRDSNKKEESAEPEIRKSKSWVWQWTRHN